MKKVLITGGLGYIGMELGKIYSGLTRSHDVTVIDNQFFSSRVNQLKIWGIKFQQLEDLEGNFYIVHPSDYGYKIKRDHDGTFMKMLEIEDNKSSVASG